MKWSISEKIDGGRLSRDGFLAVVIENTQMESFRDFDMRGGCSGDIETRVRFWLENDSR